MDLESPEPGTPVGVDLVTADPAAAQRFYGPLLGWTFHEVNDVTYCLAGEAVAASLVPARPEPMWGWRTCFLGSPLDSVAGRVRSGGGRVLDAPSADPSMMQVADPVGVPFAITDTVTRERVPPGPGRSVWHENMTTDGGTADRFYADVLGFTAVAPPGHVSDSGDAAESPATGYALLVTSGRAVGGRLVVPAELAEVLPLGWMVYFADADPDDTAARAVDLGGSVVVAPRDAPTGRVAALADPEGAVFTVIKPA